MSTWPKMPMTMPMKMMTIPTTPQQPSPPPKAIDLTITLPTPMNQLPARVQVDPCNLDALDRPFLLMTTMTLPTLTHPTQSPHQSDLLPTPPAPLSNLQNTVETSHTYDLTMLQCQTTTQQHHMQLMTMTLSPPPTIVINTLPVTTAILCHHKTLDHLEANLQRLSHSMAKTNAVLDCINHLLQQMTKTRLNTGNLTRNPTSSSLVSSPAKTTNPQQSPARAPLSSIWTPRVPPKPPHQTTTHNSCPYGPFDNQSTANTPPTAAKWPPKTHHPIPNLPAITKYTIDRMRHQPHPSPSFLTLLLRSAKNNYRPP